MDVLRERDLRTALTLVERVSGSSSVLEFATRACAALHELVPADIVAFNDMNPVSRTAFVVSDPPEALFAGATEALEEHLHEHPLVLHYRRTHDDGVRRMSDVVTLPRFHATGLYHDLFRPLGIDYLLVVGRLPVREPRLSGVAHFRQRPDFSERERALLECVREPLARAYEHAEDRELLHALELADAKLEAGVLILAPDGSIVRETPIARDLLAEIRAGASDDGRLPEHVRRRLHAASGALVLAGERGRIVAEALQRDAGVPRVLALRRAREAPPSEKLAALGLGRRETEVMRHVALGRTNNEIAATLDISPLTVKKHLERIYAKLQVPNRAAAIALAFNTNDAQPRSAAAPAQS